MKLRFAAPWLVVPPLLLAAVLRSQPPAEKAPLARMPEASFFPAPRFQLQGVSSCAAMACHNSGAGQGVSGGEYSTWIDKDKHARAYEVLFSNRSRHIEKNLYRLKAIEQAHPEKNTFCLKCHVHPHADRETVVNGGKIFQDGVSCEACHGPAEKWLSVHFHDSWRQKTGDEKRAWGMYDTKSILGRARLCLDCHVGTPAVDANHDLLAAGHPRLKFEFAAFHANMPRHWNDAKDKDPAVDPRGKPDFEARAWVIGQAVIAQAALNLLAARADNKQAPWPEFAEYDCYSCHHELKGSRSRHGQKNLPRSLSWQTWYTSMAARALTVGAMEGDKRLDKILDSIRLEMEKPSPGRATIKRDAVAAARLLNSWPEKLDRPVSVENLFWSIVHKDSDKAMESWDDASQVFNALAALHNAWSDMSPNWPQRAGARRQLFLFGRKLPDEPGYDSQGGFDLDSIRAPLRELQKLAPR
jgi:hypothetical protein